MNFPAMGDSGICPRESMRVCGYILVGNDNE